MTDRELMQQVLEALENNLQVMKDDWQQIDQEWGPSQGGLQAAIDGTLTGYEYFKDTISVITALRERLAQPEREPVDNAEKAGAYLDARLWEFIDMAAAWPEAKPDPRTWGHVLVYAPKQQQMQPCAGRNCGSTNPNLHSAECVEDYEKSTGMNQWQGLTDEEKVKRVYFPTSWITPVPLKPSRIADEAKLKEKNQ